MYLVSFIITSLKVCKFHVTDYSNTRLNPRVRNIGFHIIKLFCLIINQTVINLSINDNFVLVNPVGKISLLENKMIRLVQNNRLFWRIDVLVVHNWCHFESLHRDVIIQTRVPVSSFPNFCTFWKMQNVAVNSCARW